MTKQEMENDETTSCHCCLVERRKLRGFIQLVADITIWAIVGLPVLLIYKGAFSPYKQGFFCDDINIRYPYREDTISDTLLLVIGFTTSFILFIVTEIPKVCSAKESISRSKDFRILLKISIVFVFGFTILQAVCQSLKYAAGRLRPNFLDVCKPDFSKINCSQGYITEYECTETKYGPRVIEKSRASFPSGHAAFSMYCAIFVSIFLEMRFQVWFSRALKPVIQVILMMMSLLCSLTRIYDNKHHVTDLVAGSIIGILVALFIFKTLGEKALRSRQITFELPFRRRKLMNDNSEAPCTPTRLLPRENSSLSMDSRKYLCTNNSSISMKGVNGGHCV